MGYVRPLVLSSTTNYVSKNSLYPESKTHELKNKAYEKVLTILKKQS